MWLCGRAVVRESDGDDDDEEEAAVVDAARMSVLGIVANLVLYFRMVVRMSGGMCMQRVCWTFHAILALCFKHVGPRRCWFVHV